MKKLDIYIINEFYRTKLLSENVAENIDIASVDIFISSILSEVEQEEINAIFETENDSIFDDIQKYAMEVLNKNKLSFADKRNYSFLLDALYETLTR